MPRKAKKQNTDLAPALGGKHNPALTDAPRLGGDAALTHIVKALGDPSVEVRHQALNALTEIGEDRALEMLMMAAGDEDSSVRRRAVAALGQFAGDQVRDVLRGAVGDRDEVVRQHAVQGLGKQKNPADVPLLLETVHHYYHLVAGQQAALALGEIGDQTALDALFSLLMGTRYSSIRRFPTQAVKQIYSNNPEIVANTILWWMKRIGHSEFWDGMLPLLKKLRPVEIVPPLLERIESPPGNFFERWREAVWALSYIKASQAVPVFLKIARDEKYDISQQRLVIRSLGKFDDPVIEPFLMDLMLQKGVIGQAATDGLQQMRKAVMQDELINRLTHDNWFVRRRALAILSMRKTVEAVPTIIGRLQDSRKEIRGLAVDALVRLRHADAVPALIQALNDSSDTTRYKAALGLQYFNDPSIVPALIRLMRSIRGQRKMRHTEYGILNSMTQIYNRHPEYFQPVITELRQLQMGSDPYISEMIARFMR